MARALVPQPAERWNGNSPCQIRIGGACGPAGEFTIDLYTEKESASALESATCLKF